MIITKCPVCLSRQAVFLRYLKGKRTAKYFKLYFCANCRSLFNFSAYKEDDKALIADKQWHINHFDRNTKRAIPLLNELKNLYPQAETFLDIGCGIGATVLQARRLGWEAVGIEPNPFAVEYAKDQFSLNVTCDYFKQDSFKNKFDIISCIHVLEHTETPRLLLKAAIETLNRPGLLYLSVPFKKKEKLWKYILFPNYKDSPFFDNDVHIIHFSHKSFRLLAEEFGVTSYKKMQDGYVFEFK
jgi:2-polyprenyl-3-methyl-5-hydroxy-6-metoxy-1,4-benzoquinol methylase